MPSIPVHTAMGFVGLLLTALGVFLFLAGFNIIKIEKISVQGGKTTWIFGTVCVAIGLVLLITNESSRARQNSAQTAQPASTVESGLATPPIANSVDTEKLYAKLTQAKSWEPVLQDSFDDNDAGWILWNVDDEVKLENMQIADGVLRWGLQLRQPNQGFVAFSPAYSYTDFYYSLRARRLGDPGSENNAVWGILFRREGSRYYTFRINDFQEFALQIANEVGWTDLIGWTKSQFIEQGKVNQLTVVAEGANFYLYINGVPVGQFTDATYTRGNVGLYFGLNFIKDKETIIEFDDFELRQKPASP